MASFQSTGWPAGASVTARVRDALGNASGAVAATATADTTGTVVFGALLDATGYVATDGSRTVNFRTSTLSAASLAAAPDWTPNTTYAANQLVRAPDLSLVRANVSFTSGAVYSAANWSYIAGKGVVGYAEVRTDQTAIGSTATDLTGLALPSFTINTGDPAIWVKARVAYWVPTTVGAQAFLSLVRNEDSTVWGSAWSPKATVVNDNVGGTVVEERISAAGTYTFRARGQSVGGGTVTMKALTRVSAYIIAQREA